MSEKIPMKDLVVILPGITGSVLQKDGKDIWAISGQAIWQALTNLGDTIHHLKIEQDDPEAESLGDGIRATQLVEDTHLIPGLVKIDGYTKTACYACQSYHYTRFDRWKTPGANQIGF